MSSDAPNVPRMKQTPDTMNFMEFVAWSQNVRERSPDARFLSETRIARALELIRPTIEMPTGRPTVHRCDLARRWCEVRELPSRTAKTALVCDGVRHGLGLILKLFGQAGQRVVLPLDVYPVYWQIASEAGVEVVGVETFPDFDLQSILDVASSSNTNALLLPAPLKLHGRDWTEEELALAIAWLEEIPQRRLILDGVYSFGLPMGRFVKHLLATNQVIYLDSLSKGWLHEQIFGIAVVPESDFGIYADNFRKCGPSQEKLILAQDLLFRFERFPYLLARLLDQRRATLFKLIREVGLNVLSVERGYLIPIPGGVSSLLDKHRLVTIPVTAFGSRLTEWSIASSLSVEDQS
jgi:aspartate/methionine/tyrosine aminotransferase